MRHRLLHDDGERTFALVLDSGDEALGSVEAFAREQRLRGSRLQAVGGFRTGTLGFWDPQVACVQEDPLRGAGGGPLVSGGYDGESRRRREGSRPRRARPPRRIGRRRPPAPSRGASDLWDPDHRVAFHLHRRHDPATGLALIAGEEDQLWNR
jgi:hypothetical protein